MIEILSIPYKESLNGLEKSLRESTTKTNVVITHHVPSIKSIKDKYRNNLVSAGFASNLEAFILKTKPTHWIHGHVHDAFDYFIGEIRAICNPKGYPGEVVVGFRDWLMVEMGVCSYRTLLVNN